jgi:nuclear GTP-binding protein
LFPYKDKLLHEIEEKRRLKEEEAARRRQEAKDSNQRKNGSAMGEAEPGDAMEDEEPLIDDEKDGDEDDSNPMAALLASARARATEFEEQTGEEAFGGMDEDDEESGDTDDDEGGMNLSEDHEQRPASVSVGKEFSRRAFDKVFKQVVSTADVILYVLDARDPEGTRSKEVEREIMAADGGSKRLILILNKIDLVPPSTLKSWLIHLRRYFPTLPLSASNPAPNANTFNHQQLTVRGTSETLFKALKSYAHTKQLKRAITVGVIGYPNVGKSSVINALTSRLHHGSSAACPVGAEAGVTTSLREVKLDSKLKLIDSPGIVFPTAMNPDQATSRKGDDQARLILLNAIPPKQIEDPVPAVTLLLSRLSASAAQFEKLLEVYGVPALMPSTSGDNTTDFLVQVARKRGRLGKGGVPNLYSAAMAVITDWRDGRIQGWVDAPVLKFASVSDANRIASSSDMPNGADQKEIVKEWAEEFNLEGLLGDQGPEVVDEEMAS